MSNRAPSDPEQLVERFLSDFEAVIRDDKRIVWAYALDRYWAYTSPDLIIHLSCAGKTAMREVEETLPEWLTPVRRVVDLGPHRDTVLDDGLRLTFHFNDAEHSHGRLRGRLLKETPGHFDEETSPDIQTEQRPQFVEHVIRFWHYYTNIARQFRPHGLLTGYMTFCPLVHCARLAAEAARKELALEMDDAIIRLIAIPSLTEASLVEQIVRFGEAFHHLAANACSTHGLEYPQALAHTAMTRVRRELAHLLPTP